MTNFNDGNWHGWQGGSCPVHPKTVVQGVFSGKPDSEGGGWVIREAGQFQKECWYNTTTDGMADIVVFRVIEEYREPREVWLRRTQPLGTWAECSDEHPDAVLFREVIQ